MARATSAASPGPGSGTRTCPRPSSVMSKIFGLTSEQRPWPWQRLASMDSGTCGPLSYHVRLHAFLHEHVDEATSSRGALSAWGSGRPVCGAGDLTRPVHRTSVIRSGRGGPLGRRRFPWMYTGTPPSTAVREPDRSPVARILPPRCPVQHLSGGRRLPGPVTDLARGYVARHDAHARSAAALAPAPDAAADGRNAARRASPRGHVIDDSAPLTNHL
jgi:hypothetical protein